MSQLEFKHIDSEHLTPLEIAKGNLPQFPWEELIPHHYLPQVHSICIPWVQQSFNQPKTNHYNYEDYVNYLTRFVHELVIPILKQNQDRDGLSTQFEDSLSSYIEIKNTDPLRQILQSKEEELGGLRDFKFGYFGNPEDLTVEELKKACFALLSATEFENINLDEL